MRCLLLNFIDHLEIAPISNAALKGELFKPGKNRILELSTGRQKYPMLIIETEIRQDGEDHSPHYVCHFGLIDKMYPKSRKIWFRYHFPDDQYLDRQPVWKMAVPEMKSALLLEFNLDGTTRPEED